MSKSVSSTSFPDKCKYRLFIKKKHKIAYELSKQDANCDPSDCHLYIARSGKGFGDHSSEFNKKYTKGWCAATHNQGCSDANEATFDCNNDNN